MAELVVDANQAWDETVSLRCLRELAEMGIALVEQPVPAWNLDAMARLRRQPGTPPLLADECVFDSHDMLRVGAAGAADTVSLKLVKHASMLGLREVAAVAVAAGAIELQYDGRWLHLWRIVGEYFNVSIFDVPDHDAMHAILSTLPLFPFMTVKVTHLAHHPSSTSPACFLRRNAE